MTDAPKSFNFSIPLTRATMIAFAIGVAVGWIASILL